MALIVRIDVDRPYGRSPAWRHILSRLSSDLYFPKIEQLGYLEELRTMLGMLNRHAARAYVFFRRCTLPSPPVLQLLAEGRHEVGLHLEDSRSFESFREEVRLLEAHLGARVSAVSKHGSGGARYGLHHHAPYEPERYVEWLGRAGMKVFLGNLEDPAMPSSRTGAGVQVFPAAFWLEPAWRDVRRFTVDWLLSRARSTDVVLLVHPENVLAEPALVRDFDRLLQSLETRILQ
jgi:hypothetical protein